MPSRPRHFDRSRYPKRDHSGCGKQIPLLPVIRRENNTPHAAAFQTGFTPHDAECTTASQPGAKRHRCAAAHRTRRHRPRSVPAPGLVATIRISSQPTSQQPTETENPHPSGLRTYFSLSALTPSRSLQHQHACITRYNENGLHPARSRTRHDPPG